MPFIEGIVGADQLELALGPRGQNLRLAADLVDARIEVRTGKKSTRESYQLDGHIPRLKVPVSPPASAQG